MNSETLYLANYLDEMRKEASANYLAEVQYAAFTDELEKIAVLSEIGQAFRVSEKVPVLGKLLRPRPPKLPVGTGGPISKVHTAVTPGSKTMVHTPGVAGGEGSLPMTTKGMDPETLEAALRARTPQANVWRAERRAERVGRRPAAKILPTRMRPLEWGAGAA